MFLACWFLSYLPLVLGGAFCSDAGACTVAGCDIGYRWLNGVCLKKCPYGCTDDGSSCSGCPADVFDLKFYDQTDPHLQSIDFNNDGTEDFVQTTGFSNIGFVSRTDPTPTKQRGYYFNKESSLESVSEFIPGLDNSLTFWVWIRDQGHGSFITMTDSLEHYWIEKLGWGGWRFRTKHTKISDGTYNNGKKIQFPGDFDMWEKLEFRIHQTSYDSCQWKGFHNGNEKRDRSKGDCCFSYQFDFSPTLAKWTIGKKDGQDGFEGYLYRIVFRNSNPGIANENPSSSLFPDPPICDNECSDCYEDPWICKQHSCKSGINVQGICMPDCPYGFDCTTYMTSLPTIPVVDENFNQVSLNLQ